MRKCAATIRVLLLAGRGALRTLAPLFNWVFRPARIMPSRLFSVIVFTWVRQDTVRSLAWSPLVLPRPPPLLP